MDAPRTEEPLWLLVTTGWLVASVALAGAERGLDPRLVEARLPLAPSRVPDLDSMPVRELGCLPGIGPGRALAIARARWELGLRGAPETWDVVPGIGPRTIEGLCEWRARELEARENAAVVPATAAR